MIIEELLVARMEQSDERQAIRGSWRNSYDNEVLWHRFVAEGNTYMRIIKDMGLIVYDTKGCDW